MEKGTRVDQIYLAANALQIAGIKVGFFLQFGYPGEERVDIEKTIQMVRDCFPDDIGISVSYPLPGTKFYSAVSRQLGAKQNWIDSQDMEMLYQGPFTTRFYRKLHTVVHKEFRMQKGLKELRRVARHPTALRLAHLRIALEASYRLVTLPLDRWQLNRLAHLPHQGVSPLVPGLSPEAAAQPTPQTEIFPASMMIGIKTKSDLSDKSHEN
jgi:anaerobic magnesium-protoporphyrin IX monomethyl ester cyclase